MGCFFFPCLISNQFLLIRNKNNKLNSILLRLLQCKIILFYAKSIASICWFFFLNRLEHKYTCIHLDDLWCFKVPSPGGSSFNGCLGAVHYNLQRCSGWVIKSGIRNHSAIRLVSVLQTHWFIHQHQVLVLHFPFLLTFPPYPHVCHFRLSVQTSNELPSPSACYSDNRKALHMDCPTNIWHPTPTRSTR